MIIHVVKPGDSIYSIAKRYGVTPEKIISDNELENAERLVVGQTIVVIGGQRTHRVVQGESLYSIARAWGLTVDQLIAANPQIRNPAALTIGQTIIIPQPRGKLGSILVNGYAFPNIDKEVLAKTLPHLTYLSIFSYEVLPDGNLRNIPNDEALIEAARAENVAPIMVITNIEPEGGFSSELANTILSNEQTQSFLIENVVKVIQAKNYKGVDIDFEYVFPDDREKYNNFLRKMSERLRPLGYTVVTSLAPKTGARQQGLLYEAHDYPVHGNWADHVILMTYEWGYTYGPAMAVSPINQVKKVLDYAVTTMDSKKILMGMPNYGYDWTLPFVRGSAARTLTNTGAVELAARVGAEIQYDYESAAPFFHYFDENFARHEVWFEDARSFYALLNLVKQYNLGGVSYWTIMSYSPQNWLVLESLYNVIKVI